MELPYERQDKKKHIWQSPFDGNKTPAHHFVLVSHPTSLKALTFFVQKLFVLFAPMN